MIPIQIGTIQIIPLNDGQMMVDAGGPFGLTPRLLYRDYLTPDGDNQIPMLLTCLLVRTPDHTVLIDTGFGSKLKDKLLSRWGVRRHEGTLISQLAALGIHPDQIDTVIDTHLHGDHCTGNTEYATSDPHDGVRAAFPNARYFVQRREYEDAMRPNERTRATYLPMNYQPLVESGQMTLLDGDTEIVPGVSGIVAPGHTPGMMAIRFQSDGQHAAFLTDLAPYTIHFERMGWMTSYDVEPLLTLESKRQWREWAAQTNALLIFQHDPKVIAGRFDAEHSRIEATHLVGEGKAQ